MTKRDSDYRKFYRELLRKSRLRGNAEALELVDRIEQELVMLRLKCDVTAEAEERIMLKAELAHLRAVMLNLTYKSPRQPPEAGIAVPAIPPHGPPPQQGGAAAPLEFDS